ncbi:hypothetical protein GCM10009007_18140 [Formosimonas limnophila]|uniref:Uncharacterized protein n=1 Tax=Formosimonas limnophila TaxID=1384487 RepID=A0A8J3CPA4_9BURK|nr:DUF805 domain-containing protein [Formosimonas limnophila]GHA77593.1 hypothetical protein GCM10009007_18140 [Formosimonas limnophila]
MLAFFVVALVVMVPLGVFASGGADGGMATLGILGALLVFALSIAYLVISVIFMVRRLHDLNKSGHWLWLFWCSMRFKWCVCLVKLRHHGILVIDVEADQLPLALISQYLQLKESAQI